MQNDAEIEYERLKREKDLAEKEVSDTAERLQQARSRLYEAGKALQNAEIEAARKKFARFASGHPFVRKEDPSCSRIEYLAATQSYIGDPPRFMYNDIILASHKVVYINGGVSLPFVNDMNCPSGINSHWWMNGSDKFKAVDSTQEIIDLAEERLAISHEEIDATYDRFEVPAISEISETQPATPIVQYFNDALVGKTLFVTESNRYTRQPIYTIATIRSAAEKKTGKIIIKADLIRLAGSMPVVSLDCRLDITSGSLLNLNHPSRRGGKLVRLFQVEDRNMVRQTAHDRINADFEKLKVELAQWEAECKSAMDRAGNTAIIQ